MSVADVLGKIGDWTTSKRLIKIAAEELKITPRHAYRKIAEETNMKPSLIKKIVRSDRSVVYGLPNWPLKEDDLKLLIDAMNAIAANKTADAAQLTAIAKMLEVLQLSQANK